MVDRPEGVFTLADDGCHALRSGGSLCQPAVNDLDWLQGSSDRGLPRGQPAPDHARGNNAGSGPDRNALNTIHDGLKAKDLLPNIHLVYAGFVAAGQLVASRRTYA